MDQSKQQNSLDRVRPILQAMERSIDAARARRTHPNRPAPIDTPAETPTSAADDAPRQRARPKRSTPMTGFDDRTPFRTTPRDGE